VNRNGAIALGVAAVLAETALWHGPLGAADRFAAKIEAAATAEIKHQELFGVSARLERSPLRRGLVLSGPADDFQQAGLARIMADLPGVSGARWASPPTTAIEGAE
jgi:hypothetical protein